MRMGTARMNDIETVDCPDGLALARAYRPPQWRYSPEAVDELPDEMNVHLLSILYLLGKYSFS